jgi:hypothetical protein
LMFGLKIENSIKMALVWLSIQLFNCKSVKLPCKYDFCPLISYTYPPPEYEL